MGVMVKEGRRNERKESGMEERGKKRMEGRIMRRGGVKVEKKREGWGGTGKKGGGEVGVEQEKIGGGVEENGMGGTGR